GARRAGSACRSRSSSTCSSRTACSTSSVTTTGTPARPGSCTRGSGRSSRRTVDGYPRDSGPGSWNEQPRGVRLVDRSSEHGQVDAPEPPGGPEARDRLAVPQDVAIPDYRCQESP